MPYPLIAAGVAAGGSALANWLGSRKGARTGEQDLTISEQFGRTDDIDFTTEAMPQFDPEQMAFLQQLIKRYMGLVSEDPTSIAEGITTAGVQAANIGGRARRTGMESLMAARGLAYSPAGASSIANVENERISSIVRMLAQRPQMIDQIRRRRLAEAGQFFGQIPFGTRETRRGTTGTTGFSTRRQTGTVTQPGSAIGSAIGGGASTLGLLYGLGAFGQNQPSVKRPIAGGYDPVLEGYNP